MQVGESMEGSTREESNWRIGAAPVARPSFSVRLPSLDLGSFSAGGGGASRMASGCGLLPRSCVCCATSDASTTAWSSCSDCKHSCLSDCYGFSFSSVKRPDVIGP